MSTRNDALDRLALGYNCPECGATPDEPCFTRVSRNKTSPHSRRIDRACDGYQGRASIGKPHRRRAPVMSAAVTPILCGICGEPFLAGPYIGGVALGGLCTNAHRVWVSDLKSALDQNHTNAVLVIERGYLALEVAAEERRAS